MPTAANILVSMAFFLKVFSVKKCNTIKTIPTNTIADSFDNNARKKQISEPTNERGLLFVMYFETNNKESNKNNIVKSSSQLLILATTSVCIG